MCNFLILLTLPPKLKFYYNVMIFILKFIFHMKYPKLSPKDFFLFKRFLFLRY